MKPQLYFKLLIASLVLSFSCTDSSTEETEEKPNQKNEELKIQQLNFPKQKILLSAEASEAVEEWTLYQAMEAEIERMEKFKLEDLIANSSTIYKASDTLQKTLPQRLRNKPVSARLKVLRSKAAQLKQLAERQQPDYKEMQKVGSEIPLDFYNLNIQLNEIFLDVSIFEE